MMESAATGIEKNRPPGVKDVELVNQLWKLKQCYQQHVGGYIPLNMLINDLDYRASVLAGAAQSQVPELVALAGKIQALARARAQPVAPTADKPATEVSMASVRPRWLSWAAFGTLAVLAALITTLLAWSPSLSPTPLTVGTAPATELGAARPAPPLPAQLPSPALRLHGSNTLGERLAPALVESWLRKCGYSDVRLVPGATATEKTVYAFPRDGLPELAVQVLAHGSSTAFKDLQSGSADMGMSSRPIRASEAAALLPKLGELSGPAGEHVIALDGLAVIVHPANPLNSLTTQQVARLFAGDIKNWSSLGGHYAPVAIYARDDQSGTFDTFKSLVLERHGLKLAPAAQRLESSTELSDLVAKDVGAIGFIGLPYVRRAKLLAISESTESLAIVPTSFTVGTEDYPLSRRLFFYTPPTDSNPLIAELTEFALGRAGQEIVEQAGFVSQNIRLEQPKLDPTLPKEYLELVQDSQRLSLNFRFQPGSDRLDNKARRDLQRLVGYLAEHRDQRVALLGFTDSVGDPSYDLLLSQRRAETVEKALQARGIYPWATRGFGQTMPVASNTSPAGQQKNRRVEVWVR